MPFYESAKYVFAFVNTLSKACFSFHFHYLRMGTTSTKQLMMMKKKLKIPSEITHHRNTMWEFPLTGMNGTQTLSITSTKMWYNHLPNRGGRQSPNKQPFLKGTLNVGERN